MDFRSCIFKWGVNTNWSCQLCYQYQAGRVACSMIQSERLTAFSEFMASPLSLKDAVYHTLSGPAWYLVTWFLFSPPEHLDDLKWVKSSSRLQYLPFPTFYLNHSGNMFSLFYTTLEDLRMKRLCDSQAISYWKQKVNTSGRNNLMN